MAADGLGRKAAAREFAAHWATRGYEKGETAQFWDDLLKRVLGMANPYDAVRYEVRAANGGYIDALVEGAGVLIEQKASGVDLDAPETRQGVPKTPFEQARDYAEGFPRLKQPRYIVICNFQTFRVYDRDLWNREELRAHYLEFSLDELGENPSYLAFVRDEGNSRAEKERRVSVRAGELIGRLYDALIERYDRDSEADLHAINVLCVRTVFCLFCEDAGLFPKDAFYNYLADVPALDMGMALDRLFRALDTPREQRNRFDEKTKPFPYVNGGLFREHVDIPPFDEATKEMLLEETSKQTDWSGISPTIFGGIFESTLNPETRHAGGMHYTSPDNIHKVIDPLFLDGLRAELRGIEQDESLSSARRKVALEAFHGKISTLNFLDPACGSGNFLTETYLCLRRLEDRVLDDVSAVDRRMAAGQMSLVYDVSEPSKHVSLDQFSGIEVNDFACRVVKTALWIAKLQADSCGMAQELGDPFPLHESANVACANALRCDWNDVLPASSCAYVMGNPPFLGAKVMDAKQKEELVSVFGKKTKLVNSLDYCSAWYAKAADYMQVKPDIEAAFVSINSICQGQQVAPIWGTLFERYGVHINFAHRTFVWSNEASEQAHAHVVIVGFSRMERPVKQLFDDGVVSRAASINGYLLDAPNIMVTAAAAPICEDVPPCDYGSLINDGGNYIFKPDELDAFLKAEPRAAQYVRPLMGSDELIKGKHRFVLYLRDANPADVAKMPLLLERVRNVREQRLASTAEATRKTADAPMRFYFDSTASEPFLVIPSVSSERRRYVPMAMCTPDVVATNLVSIVPGATLYHFGILTSQFHNAWMRVVAGRMKSDYRYSPKTVYNTFPWPDADERARRDIERCAQGVLDVRARHDDCSLATLYGPNLDVLFGDLAAAHRKLDEAVEAAYGVDFGGDEERIVAHLFRLYAEKVEA